MLRWPETESLSFCQAETGGQEGELVRGLQCSDACFVLDMRVGRRVAETKLDTRILNSFRCWNDVE